MSSAKIPHKINGKYGSSALIFSAGVLQNAEEINKKRAEAYKEKESKKIYNILDYDNKNYIKNFYKK